MAKAGNGMPVWKARLQVRLAERIMAELDNPADPHALILYANALATYRVAKTRRDERKQWRAEQTDQPAPVVASPYLTARDAAAYLGIAYSTFRKRACRIRCQPQTGRYRRDDLDAFAASQRPTRKR